MTLQTGTVDGGFDPSREHDACGIGFVADVTGRATRAIVDAALDGLCGLRHRGAVAADSKTGDGAGVLLPLPREFLAAEAQRLGTTVQPEQLGVAMCFLDGDEAQRGSDARRQARQAVERALTACGLRFVGWRTVPTVPDALGDEARAVMPAIEQALFTHADVADRERSAYLARRLAERRCNAAGVHAYFSSFGFSTVTYKALSAADQLAAFYPDLCAPAVAAPYVVFHQRYSTNTLPTWDRAQPYRLLCHNGEINTIDGNVNLMRARTGNLGADWSELGDEGEAALEPLINESASDSAKLDSALELLRRGGRTIDHAMAMLVPQVWEGSSDLPPAVRDFYRYHAALVEPWDGPAGLVFADGARVGAALDRNGLRPLRYQVCDDGLIVCGSEVGAVRTAGRGGVRRERLGPGEMLLVDPEHGVLENAALKQRLASRKPYGDWLRAHQRRIDTGQPVDHAPEDLLARQIQAGFTKEEQTAVLRPLANDAKEPVSSMGDDTPLAVLSGSARSIYHFIKQRFAQVTNPPIDHLREWKVMSLRTQLGPRAPVLSETPDAVRLLELDGFLMYPHGLRRLLMEADLPFGVAGLDTTFAVADGPDGLADRLAALTAEAVAAIRSGAALLVCSDRKVSVERAAVPALLAVGAVHHALVDARLRTHASLIVETDDARETHSFAALLGYGADAICPRLAFETITELADAGRLGRDSGSAGEAQEAYANGVADGVLKIMSKMGISTLDSYRSAQVFEAIGLGADIIDRCMRGTPSVIGGIGLRELGQDVLTRHELAYADRPALASPGFYKFKTAGEYHANNPEVVDALHRAIGLSGDGDTSTVPPPSPDAVTAEQRAAHLLAAAADSGRTAWYDEYARLVNDRPATAPRDLLEPVPAPEPTALEQVEPATSIVQRFFTGAMSLGALSPESHETIAIAMNMLGASSNTGEGGEDPRRFATRGTGRDANSRSKQVASGRFGVTPQYLAYADELQIKMAQGSKPGEGGHLPGHKVSSLIARLRHTQPGVGLISPPPHHDIYSIEDLAQLIFDLKQVNPFASVSVKLVSSDGVGVVAAGVVKGLADAVQIAGCDGGTGASPLSSIKHAGLPWELGLAETQQILMANRLRGRVRLQVDGGFRTGRDVLIAALLGADEYGFGTAALLAEGCIMARACHRDTCPVGVATQRRDLRDKFVGTPETVATFLLFVAEEVRAGLAGLGVRSIDEVIGRVDLLQPRTVAHARAQSLDLQPLLAEPQPGPRHYEASLPIQAPRGHLGDQVFDKLFRALWTGTGESFDFEVRNTDRAVGARLGGAIGLEFGDRMPEQPVTARFAGEAGQSFGAFLAQGVHFVLTGEANDYVGKGMAGGRIVVRPPDDDRGDPVLVGNTVLYGATGGELFVAGRAGERFAVRNSGANAVVEGTGEHACEYMTGGVVVILGPTGFNLGAGMTGGVCYVHDPAANILARINTQLVEARRLEGGDLDDVRSLVGLHAELTGSHRAAQLLADWDAVAQGFWRIAPRGRLSRVERSDRGVGTSV